MRAAPERKTQTGISSIDADGRFCGYASLFGRVDLSGDVVMPGAFRDALRDRGVRPVRMLLEHDPVRRIGVWDTVEEDARGLWVEGRLTPGADAARAAAAMREGRLDGLSIGFRTLGAEEDRLARVRRLKRIELWEVSVVSSPMLPEARARAAGPRGLGRARAADAAGAKAAGRRSPEADVDAGLIARMRRTAAILRQPR